MPIPVLLAETDVLFCAGVAHALQTQHEFAFQQPPLRDQHSLEAALAAQPKSIAMISDALVSSLAQLAHTAAEHGNTIILLTARQHPFEFTELPAIRGTLPRNADARQLLACLQAAARGERWSGPPPEAVPNTTGARVLAQLSPRQVKVMSGVSRGAKNIEIARELGTSEQVIKNMLGGIYDLAGVSDRLELALFVLHHPELAEAARVTASGFDADS
ncbi:response regulator transcription factor [Terriglobus sp.]|uniref:helix-turn-helix transcriptional regulator n=1 Tax=Terriglobus sp. TaxID=1889013 RepID=UPI003B00E90C